MIEEQYNGFHSIPCARPCQNYLQLIKNPRIPSSFIALEEILEPVKVENDLFENKNKN